jgi:hypothetical protein
MPRPKPHPPQTVAEYAARELARLEQQARAAHLLTCPACSQTGGATWADLDGKISAGVRCSLCAQRTPAYLWAEGSGLRARWEREMTHPPDERASESPQDAAQGQREEARP